MRKSEKAEYVKAARMVRGHICHWPGCKKEVKPALWGCSQHWFRLPQSLRNKIWATYKPGQEETKTPSEAYLKVAREVQDWINVNVK